ncbi:MAG TPA: cytochrome c peroxidase, partial [Longimicrobiaceae bacterium]
MRTLDFPRICTGLMAGVLLSACTDAARDLTLPEAPPAESRSSRDLDRALRRYLVELGFTGRIEATLEPRLGRRIDRPLADLGRLLWFDPIGGLNDDNTCAGCHSPTHGFGDTQPIAIGIE